MHRVVVVRNAQARAIGMRETRRGRCSRRIIDVYVFVPDNNQGDFQQANFGCFDRSFDYRLIIPEGKFRSSQVGDRVSERSNNGDIVVLSFILYRNIKFVQIIIRNNIVTIMDDN